MEVWGAKWSKRNSEGGMDCWSQKLRTTPVLDFIPYEDSYMKIHFPVTCPLMEGVHHTEASERTGFRTQSCAVGHEN
ncbi:hypothetical protein Y1Q_0007250 [Alligator mississippiensis]|uniref:Uncharacterized protein n=1 Tax=Alligator mississippiensis TaxID=8496 RepID=A0A151NMS9_ALLMI|nr:hypothetical protein Y1Q_0007250 [Alligator mississippiensis]